MWRAWVRLVSLTRWLITTNNYSSRESDTVFWLPQVPEMKTVSIYACRKKTHTVSINFKQINQAIIVQRAPQKIKPVIKGQLLPKVQRNPKLLKNNNNNKIKLRVHHLGRNLSRFLRNQDRVQMLIFSASQIKIKTNRHSNIDGESPWILNSIQITIGNWEMLGAGQSLL